MRLWSLKHYEDENDTSLPVDGDDLRHGIRSMHIALASRDAAAQERTGFSAPSSAINTVRKDISHRLCSVHFAHTGLPRRANVKARS